VQVVHYKQHRAGRRDRSKRRRHRLEQQEPRQLRIGLVAPRAQGVRRVELPQQLAPSPERRRADVVRAADPGGAVAVGSDLGRQLGGQPRLADPGFAAEQADPTPPEGGGRSGRAAQLP
jgi:hypothetical protein